MPTLHDVTNKTKQLLKWGGILIVVLILLTLLYRGALYVKNIYFPTPRTPPTVAFGVLPPISLPESLPQKNLSYVIDTIDGKLPVFLDEQKQIRDRMKVYTISHNVLTLLDLQNTKNRVEAAGFDGNGIKISGNIYRFVKQDALPKTLDIAIVDRNFTLTSQYPFNDQVLSAINLPDQINAVNDTTSFLQTIGAYYSDLDSKKTKVQLLKLKNGVIFSADNISDAQLVRVDYFQQDVDAFPIYYPKGIYSTMNFLTASAPQGDSTIVQSDFYHQQITQDFATYPIKSVATAYQELTEGKGYIAANFVKDNQIHIQDIFLGYLATATEQNYLMPIYIFKGKEDEFYAYVSAVQDSWIQGTAPSPSPSK